MIFTFTGPQSSGKTTLLKKCREYYGSKLCYIDEVTRLIKREYGVDINETGANDVTQTLILNKEFENLFYDYKGFGFQGILHDRCIMDGMVFTTYFARGKLNDFPVSNSLGLMYYVNHIHRYDHIFYPSPHDVPLVDDGERSVNREFRDAIIDLYENYWLSDERLKGKVTILKGTVEERMEAIKIKLNEYSIR
jgi:nicotinamide riboside kinase